MKLRNCASALATLAVFSVLAFVTIGAAETARAILKDVKGQDVGSVSFVQTPAGVLIRLSLKDVPAGEHAFHIHSVGKCEPPGFDSAGGHFMWSLNRLSRDRPRRLMGVLAFRLPCGRCQL